MEHIFYYREKTDVKYPTLYNSCVRVRVRAKGKRDYSNGNEGIFQHIFSLQKNASAFDIKRKCVSLQTQGRFSSNASAFGMERKGVFFHEQKQKEISHEKGHKKGVPLNSNLC